MLMKAARLSLPVTSANSSHPAEVRLNTPGQPPARLPRVIKVTRKGPVLHTGPMPADRDVLSLNIASACAHRCAFCTVRASPSFPGDDVVYLYADASERLPAELASRCRRPRAVYISPSTDPFPPLVEVQAETARVVSVLAE